jgi:hypothetical protein
LQQKLQKIFAIYNLIFAKLQAIFTKILAPAGRLGDEGAVEMGKPVRMVKCEFEKIKGLVDGGVVKKADVYLDFEEGIIYFVPKNELGNI